MARISAFPYFSGNMFVGVSRIARAYGYAKMPGGGPVSSGLNPAVRAQIGASTEYQQLLDQIVDTVCSYQ